MPVTLMVLLVSVCVSVVPTRLPEGAVVVVNAPVPLPTMRPVREVAPVPPFATGNAVPE